jgi:D-lactate dehydrogenase (cytochrome)
VNAPAGGISLDFSRMDRILEVHAEDMDVVIQPGVTRKALNTHLRDTGLFFPVDPGADASLGGMAATRASGTNAVRYGTMKDNVLALKAVMPSGEVLVTGARARKSSAGYDLTRLIVGSEGTLGIITELTLKLHGVPEAVSAATCSFPSVRAACDTVIAVIQYGVQVARIELLDALQVKAVNAYSKLSLPETPLLLLEFHGSEASVAEQAEVFGEIAGEHGGTGFAFHHAGGGAGAALAGAARCLLGGAGLAARRQGAVHGCLRAGLAAGRLRHRRAGEDGRDGAYRAGGGACGGREFPRAPADRHGGCGEVARAERFVGWLNELAISMGGTCTGEHGIGQGKAAYLERELGPEAMAVMAAIKAGSTR